MARTSFARQKPRYKVQARVLIICEDSKSSLSYLQDAARHFRSYAEVEVTHVNRTDPKGIVAEAVKRSSSFDAVYCAIDRDSHAGFDEALQLAASQAPKVSVIASYPCYEYWLLLHFRKSTKPYSSVGASSAGDRLVKELRAEPGMNGYSKALPGLFHSLLPNLPRARERAAEVLADTENNGMNPSTRLHTLMDVLESLGTPQPIE